MLHVAGLDQDKCACNGETDRAGPTKCACNGETDREEEEHLVEDNVDDPHRNLEIWSPRADPSASEPDPVRVVHLVVYPVEHGHCDDLDDGRGPVAQPEEHEIGADLVFAEARVSGARKEVDASLVRQQSHLLAQDDADVEQSGEEHDD